MTNKNKKSFPFSHLKGKELTATKEELDDFYSRGGKIKQLRPESGPTILIRNKQSKASVKLNKSDYLPLLDEEKLTPNS